MVKAFRRALRYTIAFWFAIFLGILEMCLLEAIAEEFGGLVFCVHRCLRCAFYECENEKKFPSTILALTCSVMTQIFD